MKRLLTIAVAAASMALMASAAKAQWMPGDLMIGFEAGGTRDVLFRLGPSLSFITAGAPFSINIGNLNAALIAAFGSSPGTNANIFTAVYGNNTSPNNTLFASPTHANPASGSNQSATGSLMDQVSSEYNNEGGSNAMPALVQDSSLTPNSYLSQVTAGRVFNNFITERQFSLNSLVLDRVPSTTNGGGPATTLGTFSFSFDGSGNVTGLTFSPVPEPSTYALALAGAGILAVMVRRRAAARTKAAA